MVSCGTSGRRFAPPSSCRRQPKTAHLRRILSTAAARAKPERRHHARDRVPPPHSGHQGRGDRPARSPSDRRPRVTIRPESRTHVQRDSAAGARRRGQGAPVHPEMLLSASGRLTRNPEERMSDGGHPCTRARVARNLTPPRQEGSHYALFLDVTASRRQTAALAKYRRGDRVHMMGTLTMEQRKTDDGREVTRTSASWPTACSRRRPRSGPNDRATRSRGRPNHDLRDPEDPRRHRPPVAAADPRQPGAPPRHLAPRAHPRRARPDGPAPRLPAGAAAVPHVADEPVRRARHPERRRSTRSLDSRPAITAGARSSGAGPFEARYETHRAGRPPALHRARTVPERPGAADVRRRNGRSA